jgi:hypothetical protein
MCNIRFLLPLVNRQLITSVVEGLHVRYCLYEHQHAPRGPRGLSPRLAVSPTHCLSDRPLLAWRVAQTWAADPRSRSEVLYFGDPKPARDVPTSVAPHRRLTLHNSKPSRPCEGTRSTAGRIARKSPQVIPRLADSTYSGIARQRCEWTRPIAALNPWRQAEDALRPDEHPCRQGSFL